MQSVNQSGSKARENEVLAHHMALGTAPFIYGQLKPIARTLKENMLRRGRKYGSTSLVTLYQFKAVANSEFLLLSTSKLARSE